MKLNKLYAAIGTQELMDLVRDSEKVRIFESMNKSNPKTREDFEACVLGRQIPRLPDVQPTVPAIWIEGMEELSDQVPEDLDPHIGIPDSIPNSEDPAPPEGGEEGQSGRPGERFWRYIMPDGAMRRLQMRWAAIRPGSARF